MATFNELDQCRKEELLFLTKSLLIAVEKWAKASGLDHEKCLERIMEEGGSHATRLSAAQIHEEVSVLEQAYVDECEETIAPYLWGIFFESNQINPNSNEPQT